MAGQIWVTNTLGGYMYSDNLSRRCCAWRCSRWSSSVSSLT
jgi:hypothetical protein